MVINLSLAQYYTAKEVDGIAEGLRKELTVEVSSATGDAGILKKYTIKQGGVSLGTIDIPKDFLLKDAFVGVASAEDVAEGGKLYGLGFNVGDKYLELDVNVEDGSEDVKPVFINIKDIAPFIKITESEGIVTIDTGESGEVVEKVINATPDESTKDELYDVFREASEDMGCDAYYSVQSRDVIIVNNIYPNEPFDRGMYIAAPIFGKKFQFTNVANVYIEWDKWYDLYENVDGFVYVNAPLNESGREDRTGKYYIVYDRETGTGKWKYSKTNNEVTIKEGGSGAIEVYTKDKVDELIADCGEPNRYVVAIDGNIHKDEGRIDVLGKNGGTSEVSFLYFKKINGQSVVGDGNIEIQGGSSIVSENGVLTDGTYEWYSKDEIDFEKGNVPSDEIWYKTTDGQVITKNIDISSRITLVSNTYENGVGKLKYNTELNDIGSKSSFLSGNTTLTRVILPNTISIIGNYFLEGCTSLESIDLSNTKITDIREQLLYNCTSLKSIKLPDTIETNSGSMAFYGCTSLESIDLSNTKLKEIGNFFLGNCTSLVSFKIPDTIESVGSAFMSSIKTEGVLYYPSSKKDDAVYQTIISKKPSKWTAEPYGEVGGGASISETDGVLTDGTYEWYTKSKNDLEIAEAIEGLEHSMNDELDKKQNKLVSGENIKTINGESVLGEGDIEIQGGSSITSENGVLTDGTYEWYSKDEIDYEKGNVPNDEVWYKTTDGQIITNYNSMTGVSILSNTYENGVGKIKYSGEVTKCSQFFYKASKLLSVKLPDSITDLQSSPFFNCYYLKEVKLPNNLIKVGDNFFSNCTSLVNLDISNTKLETIGGDFLHSAQSLVSLKLPKTLTSVGYSFLYNCESLTNLDLSDTKLATIGQGFLQLCTSIVSVKLPDTLESVAGAFMNGVNTTGVLYYPVSKKDDAVYKDIISKIPSTWTAEPYGEVSGGGESGSNDNYIIYKTNDNQPVEFVQDWFNTTVKSNKYENGFGIVTFDGALTEIIGKNAFSDNKTITYFDFSNTYVENIADGFFYYQVSNSSNELEYISFPSTLKTAGANFIRATKVTSIDLTNTVLEKIGNFSLAYNTNCTILKLPSTLKEIGTQPIRGNDSLTTIYCYAKVPPTHRLAFGFMPEKGILFTPTGSDYSSWIEGTDIRNWTILSDALEGVTYNEYGNLSYGNYEWFTSGHSWFISQPLPDNEVWYISSDNKIIGDGSSVASSGNEVVSHTYENGIGKIVYEKPLTSVDRGFLYSSTLSYIKLPKTLRTTNGEFLYGPTASTMYSPIKEIWCYSEIAPTLVGTLNIQHKGKCTLYYPKGADYSSWKEQVKNFDFVEIDVYYTKDEIDAKLGDIETLLSRI